MTSVVEKACRAISQSARRLKNRSNIQSLVCCFLVVLTLGAEDRTISLPGGLQEREQEEEEFTILENQFLEKIEATLGSAAEDTAYELRDLLDTAVLLGRKREYLDLKNELDIQSDNMRQKFKDYIDAFEMELLTLRKDLETGTFRSESWWRDDADALQKARLLFEASQARVAQGKDSFFEGSPRAIRPLIAHRPLFQYKAYQNVLSHLNESQMSTLREDAKLHKYFGQNHWLGAEDMRSPSNVFESLASSVFHHYTKHSTYIPSLSGAEWWVNSLSPDEEGVGYHWDKDEDSLEKSNEYHFPVVATVTYLEAGSKLRPTVVLPLRRNSLGDRVGTKLGIQCGRSASMYISYPFNSKHIAFQGDLLHGVQTLSQDNAFDKDIYNQSAFCAEDENTRETCQNNSERITFLVNVWLDHKPSGIFRWEEPTFEKLKDRLPEFHLERLVDRYRESPTHEVSSLFRSSKSLGFVFEESHIEDAVSFDEQNSSMKSIVDTESMNTSFSWDIELGDLDIRNGQDWVLKMKVAVHPERVMASYYSTKNQQQCAKNLTLWRHHPLTIVYHARKFKEDDWGYHLTMCSQRNLDGADCKDMFICGWDAC